MDKQAGRPSVVMATLPLPGEAPMAPKTSWAYPGGPAEPREGKLWAPRHGKGLEGRRTLVLGLDQPLLHYKDDSSNKPGDPCQPGAYLEARCVTRGLEVLLGIRQAEPAKLGQLR